VTCHGSILLFIFTWFFQLLGRELFLYYGPKEGCNECLDCSFESGSTSLVCRDTCNNVEFTGCESANTKETCNVHFCNWMGSGSNTSTAGGTCSFDLAKGGICQRNAPSVHFESNTADFDTNYGGMITLGEILIGGSW
jgi:hypothetical protein